MESAFPKEDFLTQTVPSGERLLEYVFDGQPHAILMDLKLPGVQGLDVIHILKNDPRTQSIPTLALSQDTAEKRIVEALQAGADECIVHPFHPAELLWRVKALIRHYEEVGLLTLKRPELVRIGDLSLDLESREIQVSGKPVRLARKEFLLLEVLARAPNRVLKRRFLVESLWGVDPKVSIRAVDLYISRMRRKLGAAKRYIQTLPGIGYRLNP